MSKCIHDYLRDSGECAYCGYNELEILRVENFYMKAEITALREAAQAVVDARDALGRGTSHGNEYTQLVLDDMQAHKDLAALLPTPEEPPEEEDDKPDPDFVCFYCGQDSCDCDML